VVESPRPDFIGDKDLSSLSGEIRDGIKSKLLSDQDPLNGGSQCSIRSASRCRVSSLFYADAHLKANGEKELRGKTGMSAHTLWELHPITSFKLVPPAACQ
jgi:hypothetical protein